MFLLNCSSVTNVQVDTSNGYTYKLEAMFLFMMVRIATLQFLIVAKQSSYPKKRMLSQFQNLMPNYKQIK